MLQNLLMVIVVTFVKVSCMQYIYMNANLLPSSHENLAYDHFLVKWDVRENQRREDEVRVKSCYISANDQ
jgi:hypothetical protein